MSQPSGSLRWFTIVLVSCVSFAVALLIPSWYLYLWRVLDYQEDLRDQMANWLVNSGLPLAGSLNFPIVALIIYSTQIPLVLGGFAVSVKLFLQRGPAGGKPVLPRALRGSLLRCQMALCTPLELPARIRLKLPAMFSDLLDHYCDTVSVADLMVIVAWTLLNYCLLAHYVLRDNAMGERRHLFLRPHSGKPDGSSDVLLSWGSAENLALYCGTLSGVDIGWYLILPTARRSVLLEMLGLSWERAMKYHRWVAWHTTLCSLLHCVLYIMVWMHGNGSPRYDPEHKMLRHTVLPWGCLIGGCTTRQGRMLEIINWGWLALLLMITISVSARPSIRRRCFECFYLLHQLWMPFLVIMQLHWPGTVMYVGPGIAAHCVDKALAALAWLGTITARSRRLTPDIVELVIPAPWAGACRPGQYVYINVPKVSRLQWHPMSVALFAASHLSLYIRAQGDWSKELLALCGSSGQLEVKVDGFYGSDVDQAFCDHDVLVLWAGGVGITYVLSVACEACRRGTPVYLFWIVRTDAERAAFAAVVQDLTARHQALHLRMWVTRGGGELERPKGELAEFEAATVLPRGAAPLSSQARLRSWLSSRALFAAVSAVIIAVNVWGYAAAVSCSWQGRNTKAVAEILFPFVFSLGACALTLGILATLAVLFTAVTWCRGRSARGALVVSECQGVATQEDLLTSPEAPLRSPTCGRPDVAAECNALEDRFEPGASVGVMACGPLALVEMVTKECSQRLWYSQHWHLEAEDWEW